MAVFTAAAVAVSTAFTAVTAGAAAAGVASVGAALGAAAISVSAAVGVVGLGLSVVAAVTGNETLGKIGGYLGLAGAVGGLGGLAVGGAEAAKQSASYLSQRWDAAVGTFSDIGDTITAPFSSIANSANENSVASNFLKEGGNAVTNAGPSFGGTEGALDTLVNTAPGSIGGSTSASQSIAPDVISGAGSIFNQSTNLNPYTDPQVRPGPNQQFNRLFGDDGKLKLAGGGSISTDDENWWSKLDSTTKAHVALTAGQVGAGAAQGLFQSMSANEQLELNRLINSQNQNQQDLENTRTNYAPKVSFAPKPNAGLINAAKPVAQQGVR